MAVNDFLAFATAGGANVQDQADYAANPARTAGFSTGIAPSAPMNKAYRQGSFFAAVLGQLIVDVLDVSALDDGDVAGKVTLLENVITALAWVNAVITGTFDGSAASSFEVPTVAGTADSTTKAASTAFVQAVSALLAPLASPALTGTPTVPTAAPGTNTTQAASTAFVKAAVPFTKLYASGQQALSAGAEVGPFAHGLDLTNGAQAFAQMVCQSADVGYAAGTSVALTDYQEGTAGISLAWDGTDIALNVANGGIEFINPSTFDKQALTLTKWKVIILMLGN